MIALEKLKESPKFDENKKTKRINIPLSASTHTWIKMECAKREITIPELIELLVKEHMEQEQNHGK